MYEHRPDILTSQGRRRQRQRKRKKKVFRRKLWWYN
jgi:hypothetical protein